MSGNIQLFNIKSLLNTINHSITDEIIDKVFGNLTFFFVNEDNEIIKFTFDHKNFDGELMSYYIKNKIIKPIYLKNFTNSNTLIPPEHQQLQLFNTNSCIYSKFIQSISLLTHNIINFKKKDINIGIIVSTRKNNIDKGNFLSLTIINILKNDKIETICDKIYNSIQNCKKQENQHSSIIDYIKKYANFNFKVDYIFNSHRNLSNFSIENKNFKIIYKNYSINEFKYLIYESYLPSLIIINYDNTIGKYFIGTIYNINFFFK